MNNFEKDIEKNIFDYSFLFWHYTNPCSELLQLYDKKKDCVECWQGLAHWQILEHTSFWKYSIQWKNPSWLAQMQKYNYSAWISRRNHWFKMSRYLNFIFLILLILTALIFDFCSKKNVRYNYNIMCRFFSRRFRWNKTSKFAWKCPKCLFLLDV